MSVVGCNKYSNKMINTAILNSTVAYKKTQITIFRFLRIMLLVVSFWYF